MDALMLDTTFLIDLQIEKRRRREPAAHQFLHAHPNVEAHAPAIVAGEFAEGFENLDDPSLQAVMGSIHWVPVDLETSQVYASVARSLRQAGRLIGTNDLWIAASALRHRMALVTRNQREFSRVPDLMMIGY